MADAIGLANEFAYSLGRETGGGRYRVGQPADRTTRQLNELDLACSITY